MNKQMNVVFLDVGQGDGTMITSPTGELVLIDLGSKKNAEIAGADAIKTVTFIILASMEHRGIDVPTLDLLMITHGDGDHYNLLTQLIGYVRILTGEDLVIKKVAIGGAKSDYDQEIRHAILDPHDNAQTLMTFDNAYHDPMAIDGTVTPMWHLAEGAAKLYLLSANFPLRDSGPKNPKSLVVMLEYATTEQKVILTGDAEAGTELAILGYYHANPGFLESFGLKLGHHGSQAGSSQRWVELVNQLASFASSDMKWAHPYCTTIGNIVEYIGPGAQLYPHHWLCGEGAGDQKLYRNWNNEVGVYTTMAYMTESPIQDPVDGIWYSPGLVQGVRYHLSMYDNGMMQMIDTLGNDSGLFKPDHDGEKRVVRFIAGSIETEGFVPPIAIRRPPPDIPDIVPDTGCGA